MIAQYHYIPEARRRQAMPRVTVDLPAKIVEAMKLHIVRNRQGGVRRYDQVITAALTRELEKELEELNPLQARRSKLS